MSDDIFRNSSLGRDGENQQKVADVLESISKAVRGDNSSYSLSRPVPVQNVVLIGVLGFLAYKFIALAVKGRD